MINREYFDSVKDNNLIVFKNYIDNGYDITAANKLGQTALHLVMMHCDSEFFSFIIDRLLSINKLDANVRDKFGNTPLHYVVNINNTVNMKVIAGFQYVYTSRTADLTIRKNIIQQLLKYGVNINAQDKFGHTVLLDAAKYVESNEFIQYLIALGADTSICDNDGKDYLSIGNS